MASNDARPTPPLCKCGHGMGHHEWKVMRRRGTCQRMKSCGCGKYRPDTEEPKPVNKLIGRLRKR